MINDYHLLLVPKMIRARFPQAIIGLFMHIAFPSSEVFRCLEKRKQILEGMLASNVIGFQTEDHCQHFKQTCSRILYVETTDCGIQREHSFVKITASPLGIDPTQLQKDIESLHVKFHADELTQKYHEHGLKVIVGRDKLDHVKGVLHKIRSFGEFLRLHPEWVGRVVLLQFGSPPKTDPSLYKGILDLVTKINSKYSIIAKDYQPIYLKPDVSYQEYLSILTMADVFIVASVREGMNLTCHEYIFCQQQRKNPLILSEFVGSAILFDQDALMINPFDYKETANAIEKALTMSTQEKIDRWTNMDKIVHEEDGGKWAEAFLKQISVNYIEQMRKRSVDLPRLNAENHQQGYSRANKRLLIIDYEGTLLAWETNKNVMAGTGKIIDLLNLLSADESNLIYITSERTPSELERTFRRVQRLGLIAENGGYIRSPDDGIWQNHTDPSVLHWKPTIRELVTYYKERTPGSFVEESNNRIIFYYATADDMSVAQRQVSELNNHINDTSAAQGCHAIPMKEALVIEPFSISKATAVQEIYKHIPDRDEIGFIACFGNDRSDEEVFAWANALSSEQPACEILTVSVGIRNTEAKMYVQSTFGVTAALEKWAKDEN